MVGPAAQLLRPLTASTSPAPHTRVQDHRRQHKPGRLPAQGVEAARVQHGIRNRRHSQHRGARPPRARQLRPGGRHAVHGLRAPLAHQGHQLGGGARQQRDQPQPAAAARPLCRGTSGQRVLVGCAGPSSSWQSLLSGSHQNLWASSFTVCVSLSQDGPAHYVDTHTRRHTRCCCKELLEPELQVAAGSLARAPSKAGSVVCSIARAAVVSVRL